jgi:hypothetical protein
MNKTWKKRQTSQNASWERRIEQAGKPARIQTRTVAFQGVAKVRLWLRKRIPNRFRTLQVFKNSSEWVQNSFRTFLNEIKRFPKAFLKPFRRLFVVTLVKIWDMFRKLFGNVSQCFLKIFRMVSLFTKCFENNESARKRFRTRFVVGFVKNWQVFGKKFWNVSEVFRNTFPNTFGQTSEQHFGIKFGNDFDKHPKMFHYETSETSSKTRSKNLSEHNSINFGRVLRQVLNLFQRLVSELTAETFLKTLTTVQNDTRNSLLKIQNGLLQHSVESLFNLGNLELNQYSQKLRTIPGDHSQSNSPQTRKESSERRHRNSNQRAAQPQSSKKANSRQQKRIHTHNDKVRLTANKTTHNKWPLNRLQAEQTRGKHKTVHSWDYGKMSMAVESKIRLTQQHSLYCTLNALLRTLLFSVVQKAYNAIRSEQPSHAHHKHKKVKR